MLDIKRLILCDGRLIEKTSYKYWLGVFTLSKVENRILWQYKGVEFINRGSFIKYMLVDALANKCDYNILLRSISTYDTTDNLDDGIDSFIYYKRNFFLKFYEQDLNISIDFDEYYEKWK